MGGRRGAFDLVHIYKMAEYPSLSSSFNPWSTDHGSVAGMQLGDPESGLVIARRCDLHPMEEVCDRLKILFLFLPSVYHYFVL